MAKSNAASDFVLNKINELVTVRKRLTICEIGCGEGNTSLKIVSQLRDADTFYFMDYYGKVKELRKKMTDFKVKTKGIGNGRSYYDSYAWNLAKLYFELVKEGRSTKIFDLVFLDASNLFIHDCSACAIIKKMMKPGGLVVINNTSWSFSKSKYWAPSNNEETLKMMSKEQSEISQDDVVCKVLFDTEFDYKLDYTGDNYKVYKFTHSK